MDKYIDYILNLMDMDLSSIDLIFLLLDKPFVSLIEFDKHRELDGLFFRKNFIGNGDKDLEKLVDPYWFNEVSVCEVLAALSQRIDKEYIGSSLNPRPGIIFKEMLDNLGLNKNLNPKEIDDILNRFIYRKYSPDGVGGIFPLKHPKNDQREIEIWSQMQAYLMENYRLI